MAVEMWKMQAFQPSLQTYREMIRQRPFFSFRYLSITSHRISKILLCALWNNLRNPGTVCICTCYLIVVCIHGEEIYYTNMLKDNKIFAK
jgi:hypothetical protein